MAADGKSLITSVGIEDSSVWLHDAKGEHQISSEGYSGAPLFSPDSRRLYYLRSSGENMEPELWFTDLASGVSGSVLSGYMIRVCGVTGAQHYALSPDGTEIAFSMLDQATGRSKVWIAATDRRSSPQPIETSASEDCPSYLPNGDLVFRAVEANQNFLYRMSPEGTERRKISDIAILDYEGVSHDGRWALAITRGSDGYRPYSLAAFPIDGGPIVSVCQGLCQAVWDRTGKWLYISPTGADTYALPLRRSGLPRLPPAGIAGSEELAQMKVPRIPPEVFESAGTPSQYAYTRRTTSRNLYRIPVP
jgi:Tol biopolymer transport system component